MTALSLAASSPQPALASAPRAAFWTALALAFAALVLPDCCLSGRHVAGFGMESSGPICHGAQ